MATAITIRPDVQRFPEGTSIGAYVRPKIPAPRWEIARMGTVVESQVETAGACAFVALADKTDYVGYANVSGEDRFMQFSTR